MSGVKWTVEVDNNRECYRILTDVPVMEHDGVNEQQWIADVFEYSDAVAIANSHNAALETMEENGSSHNKASAPCKWRCSCGQEVVGDYCKCGAYRCDL